MLRRFAFVALVAVTVHCGGKTDQPPVSTYVIGTDQGDPNDPTSGRDPLEDGGTLGVSKGGGVAACSGKVTPFQTNFDRGNVADNFTVNEPSAFSTVAVDGGHTLQIAADSSAYLSHPVPNVCAVTVAFSVTLSAAVIASGVKLVQVDAQKHFFALIVDPGGALHMEQTATSTGGGTTGDSATMQGPLLAPALQPNVSLSITLAIDVSAKSMTTSIGVGGSSDVVSPNGYFTSGGDDVAIDEIDFGSAPNWTGPPSSPSGTWQLGNVSVQ